MSATILLLGKTIATLDDTGEWHCEDPILLNIVRSIAEDYPGQRYLPDPYEKQRDGVIRQLGGKRLELNFPPQPDDEFSPDGTPPIY